MFLRLIALLALMVLGVSASELSGDTGRELTMARKVRSKKYLGLFRRIRRKNRKGGKSMKPKTVTPKMDPPKMEPSPSKPSGATVNGLCFEAEKQLQSKGVRSMGGWVLENYGGRTIVRFTAGNAYGQSKALSKLCYKVSIPRAGTYRVWLEGRRDTKGRVPIKCNHGNKDGSLSACARKNGRKCVCNDEENDVWLEVEGNHKTNAHKYMQPVKAMIKCGWGDWCKQSKLNIGHKMIDAAYNMSAGSKTVCIGGRSTNMGVDRVCLTPA